MSDNYIKEQKIKEKSENERDLELIMSVIKTKRELESARQNYESAEDELIDYFTYEIKAVQAKFDYLVKSAKSKGLALDMINEIYLRTNKVV